MSIAAEPLEAAPRVLVVEDERIVALHLRQQLARLGYDVVALAASGERALNEIERLRPDIVLMDINIEGEIDGIETASRIPAELHTPVVYLTAYSEEATLARARATKPYGYLLKPFTERELHATIQMVLERRKAELALRISEERLRLALEAAGMGSLELEATSRTLLPVGRADEILGLTRDGFLSASWADLLRQVHPADRSNVQAELARALDERSLCAIEFRSPRADGTLRWLSLQGRALPLGESAAPRLIGVVQDITERRAAEQSLRQAATVLEASQDGIVILDRDLKVSTVNTAFEAMTGYSAAELVGHRPYLLQAGAHPEGRWAEIEHGLTVAGRWRGEVQGWRKDASSFPMLMNIASVTGEGSGPGHVVMVCTDMTAVRRAEEQLHHLAHHDPLTDLPNRLLALDRLDHALERAARRSTRVAVLFIDLDYFKQVNDGLGHGVGDDLLRAISHRMRERIRAEDTLARFGGDEFMAIAGDLAGPDDAAVIARKLLAAVEEPVHLAGQDLRISASIGISLYPDDAAQPDALVRAADAAMYAAKDAGKHRFRFHNAETTARAASMLASDLDLRRAMANRELTLHYQPQVSLQHGSVLGVEALLRRLHPEQGLLTAASIIPVAERTNRMGEIGDWVLREACSQAAHWRAQGLVSLRVAVNVSARQLITGDFIQLVDELLRTSGLVQGQLEIEITENMLQNQLESLVALSRLNRLGVTLAIDDFGTGYSCLSSLRTLPIHRIKIDKAFVRELPDNKDDVAIVEAIVVLAHRLGLSVLAEGVETPEQEAVLRMLGCDEAQGFHYARAMPADEFTLWLEARQSSRALPRASSPPGNA
jgi:diguanylate cyclase (GGDEF)-like protein/PAS domain S-box-containing protein